MRDLLSDDNGGRRKNSDRRQFAYTLHIPERRQGSERRATKDRRKSGRNSDNHAEIVV